MRTAKIASRARARARWREREPEYRASVPGPIYCDASALLKLYVSESGSTEFNRTVEGRTDLLVSDLAVTEVVSALAHRVRQGSGTREIVRRVQRAISEAVEVGAYRRVELTREVHRRAEHFLLALVDTPLRAADALHLALALSARAVSMASFDARLAAAARAVGLSTYPA